MKQKGFDTARDSRLAVVARIPSSRLGVGIDSCARATLEALESGATVHVQHAQDPGHPLTLAWKLRSTARRASIGRISFGDASPPCWALTIQSGER